MTAPDEAPEELSVQTDLDGFRCELRPYSPPDDWLLLIVPVWWAAGVGFLALVLWLDPSLADAQIDTMPPWAYLAWPVGLFGWAPFFMWWRARRRRVTVPMNLDPGRLTVGGQSWAVGDITGVEPARFGLRLTLRQGTARLPMRSNSYAARRWVSAQIEAAVVREAPAPPRALQALRGVED